MIVDPGRCPMLTPSRRFLTLPDVTPSKLRPKRASLRRRKREKLRKEEDEESVETVAKKKKKLKNIRNKEIILETLEVASSGTSNDN